MVVDESNQPVAKAEVFVAMAANEISLENGGTAFNYFTGKPARDSFSARTDAAGHFRIENFPTNASAASRGPFAGKSPAPVAAKILPACEHAGYRAGQTDIKLVVEPAGSIEGKIVGGESEPTVAGRAVDPAVRPAGLVHAGRRLNRCNPALTARFDSATCRRFLPHSRRLRHQRRFRLGRGNGSGFGRIRPDHARCSSDGGARRVAGSDRARQRRPQAGGAGQRHAYRENSQSAAISDSNGIARLRLIPGDYQVAASRRVRAFKPDFRHRGGRRDESRRD